MVKFLDLPHGSLKTPLFMPDATFGVVRSVDTNDLVQCGIQAVMMNTFHLMQRPGSSIIKAAGGLHQFSGWPGPIITDSGGFQAYSLIRRNKKLGNLTNKGIIFKPEGSTRKYVLTPEKSIQLQLQYDSDVAICLDDCTHSNEPTESQQESVDRTINWARRCKDEFERRTKNKKPGTRRPLLFAVVQGGADVELRKTCAEHLLNIGFDGFGYGGYPLDDQGKLLTQIIEHTRTLIPKEYPMIALGIGEPRNIIACARSGYDIFDSSLPTRDARQGRLYSSSEKSGYANYSYVYIADSKYAQSKEPISLDCDCQTCTNYSLAYLRHLFKIRDPLYFRLSTIHNLRFIVLMMESLRGKN